MSNDDLVTLAEQLASLNTVEIVALRRRLLQVGIEFVLQPAEMISYYNPDNQELMA